MNAQVAFALVVIIERCKGDRATVGVGDLLHYVAVLLQDKGIGILLGRILVHRLAGTQIRPGHGGAVVIDEERLVGLSGFDHSRVIALVDIRPTGRSFLPHLVAYASRQHKVHLLASFEREGEVPVRHLQTGLQLLPLGGQVHDFIYLVGIGRDRHATVFVRGPQRSLAIHEADKLMLVLIEAGDDHVVLAGRCGRILHGACTTLASIKLDDIGLALPFPGAAMAALGEELRAGQHLASIHVTPVTGMQLSPFGSRAAIGYLISHVGLGQVSRGGHPTWTTTRNGEYCIITNGNAFDNGNASPS